MPLINPGPLALIGQAVSEKKMFEIVNDNNGQRMDAVP